jgi:hypothetical protein
METHNSEKINIQDYKRCNNKKCLKPIKLKTEFFKDSSRADNLSPQCKDCKRKLNDNYFENNEDTIKSYHTQYFQDNKQHLMELNTVWKNNNPTKVKEIQNRYTSKNLDKRNSNTAIRRARLIQAMPKWADQKQILEIYKNSRELSISTGIQHHVDHIIPLKGKTVCGLHVIENLQILTAHENQVKNAKFEDFEVEEYYFNYEEILKLLSDEDIV